MLREIIEEAWGVLLVLAILAAALGWVLVKKNHVEYSRQEVLVDIEYLSSGLNEKSLCRMQSGKVVIAQGWLPIAEGTLVVVSRNGLGQWNVERFVSTPQSSEE